MHYRWPSLGKDRSVSVRLLAVAAACVLFVFGHRLTAEPTMSTGVVCTHDTSVNCEFGQYVPPQNYWSGGVYEFTGYCSATQSCWCNAYSVYFGKTFKADDPYDCRSVQ